MKPVSLSAIIRYVHPLETYLRDLHEIRSTGSAGPETSYYSALANLLNEAGRGLRPRVRCVLNPASRGAGVPDGGLFTASQYQRGASDAEVLRNQRPERGVVEVKSPGTEVVLTARTPQIAKYWHEYGLVLVTNYREFILVGKDTEGQLAFRESYRLAEDEEALWNLARNPRPAAEEHGERFLQYLRRTLLQAASLERPKDVAWFLASYARDARARIEKTELPALAAVRQALEEALGVHFEGGRGDHFFRSTLVQTLFYGIFSAWVLWHKENPSRRDRFDWKQAAWSLRVPMISALFEQVATPHRLEPLGLVEPLDWAAGVLNRVDRKAFFIQFEEEHAVQYFYEPFLEDFDPDLRKSLGVWYTPPEVVKYMVDRVDAVLRSELGLEDGLAAPNVYVLDPCCGTGAFLVGVLRKIATILHHSGGDALVASDLKRAARERVFGFEVLTAPFVVAHLQLGLLLRQLGAPLSERRSERPGVYLTNALTGWEPLSREGRPRSAQLALNFPELAQERDAANEVKRDRPILVVLGNPPYNGYAGLAIGEERELTEAYRTTVNAPAPQGQGLNELYVRFFRMAERKIVEGTKEGIVCFISSSSWLEGLSHTGMRERYLDVFDRIWIDNLNGDRYKTGKQTPDGKPDPSIFSTERNREGIQIGTAITLLVRKSDHRSAEEVRFRNLWGTTKREQLLASLQQPEGSLYGAFEPPLELGLPFLPARASAAYSSWPGLPDLFPVSLPGVKTSRDALVVDIDRDRLEERMSRYFDPRVDHEEMRRMCPDALASTSGFNAEETRETLRRRGLLPGQIVRYHYQPFDLRWIYWEPETKLLDRKREDLFPLVMPGNLFLTSRQKRERSEEGSPFLLIRHLPDWHLTRPGCSGFPLRLSSGSPQRQDSLFGAAEPPTALNLSPLAQRYLSEIEAEGPLDDLALRLVHHALAIGHAPRYLSENEGALWQDWPRIPLPQSQEQLARSAELGEELAALLDLESSCRGVTQGEIRPELRMLGVFSVAAGHVLDEEEDLSITAGWGHPGRGGIVMPGRGNARERDFSPEERAALAAGAQALGLDEERILDLLGRTTFDIHLNKQAFWRNVPARVWAYTLGGYQILKKWLSYREREILGRPLRVDEVREVTAMVRRIAALRLLEPALDESYELVKAVAMDRALLTEI